jgi:putative transposase
MLSCPTTFAKEHHMSRFKKLSHTIWHCKYHIIWVPKYRLRILKGELAKEVERCIRSFAQHQSSEVIELKVCVDHVHLLASIPPKISISNFVGTVKGRTAIRIFNQFRNLRQKPYWGNHFWAKGYCVDTIGFDEQMIRKYIKHQEQKEKRSKD